MAKPAVQTAPSSSHIKGPVFIEDVFGAGLVSMSGSPRTIQPISFPSSSAQSSTQSYIQRQQQQSQQPMREEFKAPGGELERIRQRQLAEHAAVEARRPDFFVREGKRKADGSDVSRSGHVSNSGSNSNMHPSGVGIMDSPTKGRRIKLYASSSTNPSLSSADVVKDKIKLFPDLKLFQETSEESFEESLMAGGYGRYRTAEWVRQPQPIPIEVLQAQVRHGQGVANPAVTGSPIVKRLEDQSVAASVERGEESSETPLSEHFPAQPPQPPTEKELRKRKRLDAFRVLTTASSHSASSPTTVTVDDSDNAFVNKDAKSNGKGSFRKESPRKLYPVELEGRGRVLVDVLPGSSVSGHGSEDAFVQETTGGAKRKKRNLAAEKREREISPEYPYGLVISPSKKRAELKVASGVLEKPNWPDAEFPWRLREEERDEAKLKEEEERLKCVERFLERDDDSDSTDHDDNPFAGGSKGKGKAVEEDDDLLPSSQWGVVYHEERPTPFKAGRGKMVPLKANAAQDMGEAGSEEDEGDEPLPLRRKRSSMYFPSDPADARAALLSKRIVRALSFRKQLEAEKKRKRMLREARGADVIGVDWEEKEEEVPCICDGAGANFEDDDARVVQCDSCDLWYHFGCMGIRSGELRDVDKWFCPKCAPLVELEPEEEPVFVPTEETQATTRELGENLMLSNSRSPRDTPEPEAGRSAGLPPVPPLSSRGSVILMSPKTPIRRRSRAFGGDYLDDLPSSSISSYSYAQLGSSSSSLLTSSSTRGYPVTPRHRLCKTEPRVHGQDPLLGSGNNYEESPLFDPLSTPSRGIKFNVPPPFTTPTRKPGNGRTGFYTPSRKSVGGFGGPGFLSSALDDKGDNWAGYGYGYGGDESPIRRKKSSISSDPVMKSKRVLDELLASVPGAAGGLAEGFDDSSLGRSPSRNREVG
ncbi:hypothetical protein E1B28_009751 [Marasmius oreades]|uniref:PHD-type domain-containing protein n=1 Tax=Marasmius oreades TaxID=181124 RepID=A0A9P7UR22_9AGAR|nr:uncharacterized protein E1B28_009751 [Marasmius oreades]KAG7090650.1 hypothetical protein E1B28_009751 [Marasmius oreades]